MTNAHKFRFVVMNHFYLVHKYALKDGLIKKGHNGMALRLAAVFSK